MEEDFIFENQNNEEFTYAINTYNRISKNEDIDDFISEDEFEIEDEEDENLDNIEEEKSNNIEENDINKKKNKRRKLNPYNYEKDLDDKLFSTKRKVIKF
jgi:hypothetical protein